MEQLWTPLPFFKGEIYGIDPSEVIYHAVFFAWIQNCFKGKKTSHKGNLQYFSCRRIDNACVYVPQTSTLPINFFFF